MSAADPDAYIRGLTKLIANDRVCDDQGRSPDAPAQSIGQRCQRQVVLIYTRDLAKQVANTVVHRTVRNARACGGGNTIRVTDYLPTSRPERDIENRYTTGAYNALLFYFAPMAATPRFHRNVVDIADGSRVIRKNAGIKRILYCENNKKKNAEEKRRVLKYDILCVKVSNKNVSY